MYLRIFALTEDIYSEWVTALFTKEQRGAFR
jgi:hypothetical protein